MERLINRRQQGDLGEVSAIEWLTSIGATVSIPFGYSPDYDVLAEIDGRLLRIQVKTSTYVETTPNGDKRHQVTVATNGGNQSWNRVSKRFDPACVDALFVLTGDGRRWFIPAARVEGETAICLGGAKYSEFEIERGRPIRRLVYGDAGSPLESKPRRGSADVGESGETVNLVPMAEWVRIPPPPSIDGHWSKSSQQIVRRSERTRISSAHQITIPATPFRTAERRVGDRLHVRADGPGRVIIERIESPATIFDAG
jgi:hypothetical protein